MTKAAQDYWSRALKALEVAQGLLLKDADSCASRSYYAAFYAVTALFLLEDKSFSKHSGVKSAIHSDLVKPGHWPAHLGSAYDFLMELRNLGDYGGPKHVSQEDAEDALTAARSILDAVRQTHPDLFTGLQPPL